MKWRLLIAIPLGISIFILDMKYGIISLTVMPGLLLIPVIFGMVVAKVRESVFAGVAVAAGTILLSLALRTTFFQEWGPTFDWIIELFIMSIIFGYYSISYSSTGELWIYAPDMDLGALIGAPLYYGMFIAACMVGGFIGRLLKERVLDRYIGKQGTSQETFEVVTPTEVTEP